MNTKILNLLVILIIVIAGALGYFVFVKKPAPANTSQTPTSSNITQETCSDIVKIDFKNRVIKDSQFGDLAFKNGVFEQKDDLGGTDWEHKIVDDFTLTPETSEVIRFIKISSNHLSGSGAWDRLIGFRCGNGGIEKVFDQRGLYGIKVQKIGNDQLSLTIGEWTKNDPVCCPSQQKASLFQWNTQEHTFVLKQEKVQKIQP